MRQSKDDRHAGAGAYAALLESLDDEVDTLGDRVARDVARGATPGDGELEVARSAVRWLLDSLRAGPVPTPSALRVLRDGGAAQARAGEPVGPVLDRTLSAGWVLWAAVTATPGLPAPALAALGEALLRTGDAASAAIADAHAAAERELATRSASALRGLLDELLELPEGDGPGRARLGRRLAEAGIPHDRAVTLVLVDAGRELADGDRLVTDVARALGRAMGSVPGVSDPRSLGGQVPAAVVATTRGQVVLLLPAGRWSVDPTPALRVLGSGWIAVTSPAATLSGVAAAFRDAAASLVVAVRLGLRDRVLPAEALSLERAMLAAPAQLAAAVERELAPLEAAPRGAALVETVEAYLAERENIRAAGRRLGVAPRTVAYRLARVERLLGGPLDADRRLRLATALFARRLLVPRDVVSPQERGPARRAAGSRNATRAPRAAAAGQPRTGPAGRSSTRRSHAQAT
jgi:hypothetical protein